MRGPVYRVTIRYAEPGLALHACDGLCASSGHAPGVLPVDRGTTMRKPDRASIPDTSAVSRHGVDTAGRHAGTSARPCPPGRPDRSVRTRLAQPEWAFELVAMFVFPAGSVFLAQTSVFF
jgi:hypothetical protein